MIVKIYRRLLAFIDSRGLNFLEIIIEDCFLIHKREKDKFQTDRGFRIWPLGEIIVLTSK